MSSLIVNYAALEEQLKAVQEQLKALESSDRLKEELELKKKLEALMEKYNVNLNDIIQILDPNAHKNTTAQPRAKRKQRKQRKLKIYQNPNTGEVFETRGGNHKTLKAWKEEFGEEVVESWLVREED